MRRRKDELLERLRDSNPSPSSRVAGWSRTSEGKATMERVRAEIDSEEPVEGSITKRRRRGPFLLAAALVALLTLAGSYAVFSRHPTVSSTAACYHRLSQRSFVVSVVVAEGSIPTEVCSREWPSYFNASAPPRLAECVLEGGAIGVFPYPASMDEREACSSIGAAIPAGGPES